ncbi:hypothetical protein EZL74_07130 [Flavobacterium silvisoli]|uniref:Lipocalin-like domain-containing protein n=1 Tax=Flavobacterium silvisoli TaxID=2529433 RepID=A0A4Q9YYY1_9FLAO|nr:hypothetical protein [Flavobacterium silvisoli]TBX69144.1 hypothetical protein EZL74_07130 [Flavobacterium silvisoli]
MKKICFLGIAFILISCHSNVKKEDLVKLNGYWEIKQVKLADGEKKDYKVNETVDFFEVKNNAGFRQKVMPQFDGKFKTNDIKENIKIIEENKTFFIQYDTPYGKWKEEIIEIADSTLVLKNKDKLQYEYKRFVPFSLK